MNYCQEARRVAVRKSADSLAGSVQTPESLSGRVSFAGRKRADCSVAVRKSADSLSGRAQSCCQEERRVAVRKSAELL